MIAALALAAAAATSTPAAPARLVYCHQGECSWSREVSNRVVRTVRAGTLRRYSALNGISIHRGRIPTAWSPAIRIRWPARPSDDYVFCSRSQPALAFRDEDGTWIAHALDLFDLYGYDTASAVIYLRACHGLEYYGRNVEKRLRALGYRPGSRSEQVEIKSPDQLVALPPRRRD